MKVLITEWLGDAGTEMLKQAADVKVLNQWFIATGVEGSEAPTEEELIREIKDGKF